MCIQLVKMTLPLLQQFFSKFTPDPDTYLGTIPKTIFDRKYTEAFFEKQNRPDREHFAILYEDKVIGDLYLKHIDTTESRCTLSIHMECDTYKNRGFGTKAETLALGYAFHVLQLNTVYADALIKNERSCHVLQKVGFVEIERDQDKRYFCCQKPQTPI